MAISPTGKAASLVDREGFMWGGTPDFKVKGRREGGWKRSVAMRGWGCQWEEEGEGL